MPKYEYTVQLRKDREIVHSSVMNAKNYSLAHDRLTKKFNQREWRILELTFKVEGSGYHIVELGKITGNGVKDHKVRYQERKEKRRCLKSVEEVSS